jgi:hypothetical protein
MVMAGVKDIQHQEERQAAQALENLFPPIDPRTLEQSMRRVVAIVYRNGRFHLRNYSVRIDKRRSIKNL